MLSKQHMNNSLAMLVVYFLNAFNRIGQPILLHEEKVRCPFISVWVGFFMVKYRGYPLEVDILYMSVTKVQQGDSLGLLFYALVLRLLIHHIRDNCKLLFHVWYFNDGTIIGDYEDVGKVLNIIRKTGTGLSLELNIRKIEIF